MSEFYGETHRAFQEQHDTRRLADRLESLAHRELDADDRAFVEAATFFFISTVDQRGRPTVSYKGGPPGFVRVTGPSALTFPIYDGNGMFLSLGNIAASGLVGLLFIDFESARRLRVQGAARVIANDGADRVPGAIHLVRIDVSQVFVNCGRYIHKLETRRLSPHVPDDAGRQPFPAWKRLDFIADAVPERDKTRVADAGGPIPLEQYPGEESPAKSP